MINISDEEKEIMTAFKSFNLNLNDWKDEPQHFQSENKRYIIDDRINFTNKEDNKILFYSKITDKEQNKIFYVEFIAEYTEKFGTRWLKWSYKKDINE